MSRRLASSHHRQNAQRRYLHVSRLNILVCLENVNLAISRNVTNTDSPGYTSKDDPVYTSLPPSSRKHPAPIDPSSKEDNIIVLKPLLTVRIHSIKMVLHFAYRSIIPKKMHMHHVTFE